MLAGPRDPAISWLFEIGLLPSSALPLAEPYLGKPNRFGHFLQRCIGEKLLTPFQTEMIESGRGPELVLGDYHLLEKLGSGATGNVYLADHHASKSRFAIKILACDAEDQQPASLARFRREARAATLLYHPNVVKTFDLVETEGRYGLVMEYLPGISLDQLVRERGPLPVAQAIEFALHLAQGLLHIHKAGLLHRDIKPANVMLTPQGTVKILDLGLARFTDHRRDDLTHREGGHVLGTIDFMAPEQAETLSQIDERADIYALGATLYFLLTGEPPLICSGSLSTKIIALQFRNARPIKQFRSDIDPEIESCIEKLLAKSPENRLANAMSVIAELQRWCPAESAPTLPERDAYNCETSEEICLVAPSHFDGSHDDKPSTIILKRPPRPPHPPWMWWGAILFGVVAAVLAFVLGLV